MTRVEFKKKFFTDNFYWITKTNHIELQKIGLEMGCLLCNGEKDIINWHEGFNSLGFRTKENITYFQKEIFLTEKETSTNYMEMLREYKKLEK